jgi:phosphoribosyl 1,2-cyclic phosphodiesterase
MEVTFWGVRGDTPVPGADYVRYGGNTSCIDICDGVGHRAVMDAGTGIIGLGKSLLGGRLGKGQGEIYIFLTHTYWDHVQGFPYLVPAYIPGNKINFWGRSVSDQPLKKLLEEQMRAEFSPIYELANMGSEISVNETRSDSLRFGEFTMATTVTPHRGKDSLGYRISDGKKTCSLLVDLSYEDGVPKSLVDFVNGADVLVHDAGETYPENGHPAVDLARKAGVKHLVMTHYPPDFTDDDVDRFQKELQGQAGGEIRVEAAREGLSIVL